MLSQLLQALRFAIADFFAVPWPAVAALSVAVLCMGAFAYVRTVYSLSSHQMLQAALLMGALIGAYAAGNYLKRR